MPRVLFERHVGWVFCTLAINSLGGCGVGIVSGDEEAECTTTRCMELGKNCGEMVIDGCGVIRCGDCEAPATCGGGDTPNVCGSEECNPSWECETPLNGNEEDHCGNRRPNPICDPPSPCGNGVKDPGEFCDRQGNVGCNGTTPICRQDCGQCIGPAATLLWDGSFDGDERRTGVHSFVDPDGSYSSYACLPQPDSFAVVEAKTLPGARAGYAGKFHVGVGSAYLCNGNQHNIILSDTPLIPQTYDDVWYGFSMMYDLSWAPAGGPTNHLGFSAGLGEVYLNTPPLYPNTGLNYQAFGSTTAYYLKLNKVFYTADTYTQTPGYWYDYLWHVKWTEGKDGFLDVYIRPPGASEYSLWKSKTNIQTVPTNPFDTYFYGIRVGIYRKADATTAQTLYVMNPKIGRARAAVEFF